MRILLPLAAAIAATLSAQSPLTTTFAGGNGQSGNMFDVVAVNAAGVMINYFDVNLDPGTWDMEIYKLTVPGPYLPSVNIATDWTLVGSALGVVSAGAGVPTLLPISVCEYIPPGSTQSFYVTVTNGTAINYTNGTATGALYTSNPDLEFYEGAGLAYPFIANFNPRVFNGNIYYGIGPTANCGGAFASKTTYGTACYNNPRMVSEYFPGASVIDLVNTQWLLSYTADALGGSYTVTPGGLPYDATVPAAAGVNLVATPPVISSSGGTWDDASVIMPLGFNFPYPNAASATVADITINSNGRIYLGASTDATFASTGANSGFTPTSFAGTTGIGLPIIAGFMTDLDPNPTTGGGSIWYEAASPNGGVRITWDNVPNWQDGAFTGQPAVPNDIQMELLPGGLVFLSFGPSLGNGGSAGNEAITGFSAGAGEDEVRVDWSTITNYTSGNGLIGLSVDSDITPTMGSTVMVTVDNVPAGSLLAGIIYGLTKFDPGIPLASLGMPCDLYASLDVLVTGILPAASFTSPFPIPNNPALSGAALAAQGFALNAAIPNSFGGQTSNGLELIIGN